MRTLQQLLLAGEPVAPSELREMTLRHILSAPHSAVNAPVTAGLITAYLSAQKLRYKLRGFEAAKKFMEETFVESGGKDFKWPAAIPDNLTEYPREMILEVGIALAHPIDPDTN